jgi:hypothetical protein
MKTITGLYSASDWAELFSLCANATDAGEADRGSQTWIDVHSWLCEWTKAHDFPAPEETDSWSDTGYVIKETVMFLEKFAENIHDDFEHRKDAQDLKLEQNK